MENLKEHYEQLVKKYREIFVSVLSAMQGEISALKPEEVKNYLEVEVEKLRAKMTETEMKTVAGMNFCKGNIFNSKEI